MTEEQNKDLLESEEVETPAEAGPQEQQTATEATEEKEQTTEPVSPAQRRGRMIAGGLVTAVVVSLVVVLVAGIFQFSSKWLKPCSTELPVNDPSPKLWQEMVSQKVTIQGLGVPEMVRAETQFKKPAPVTKESGSDAEAKERK
jgi:hypothetical protein